MTNPILIIFEYSSTKTNAPHPSTGTTPLKLPRLPDNRDAKDRREQGLEQLSF
jgi:hypothetical protein